MLTENLLYYIWKLQLFDSLDLKTKSGVPLQILKQGFFQPNAGPDFTNAKVKIGNIILAGNIELHINESEWRAHNHHSDKAYNTVILHVVWQSLNEKTVLENGETAEVLELKKRIDKKLLARYELLMNQQQEIACSELKSGIDTFLLSHFLQKVGVERLERKVAEINTLLAMFNGDWSQTVFAILARYLGGSVNNEPMERLAASIPIKILYKNRSQPQIVEAVLFGQAGLLHADLNDNYAKQLFREYQYQRKLHHLRPLEKTVWKYAKIRPKSFPAIRVAQLASLVSSGNFELERLLAIETVNEFSNLFSVPKIPYWQTHYDFDKAFDSVQSPKLIGKQSLEILAINFFVPLLFAYGKYTGNETLCDKAFNILENIPAEKNNIITHYHFLLSPKNASETQALLELKANYCSKLRCLNCAIGSRLLQEN